MKYRCRKGEHMHDHPHIYILEGIPIPLARARYGNGKTWNPQKEEMLYYRIMLEGQHSDRSLYEGPLKLDITFYMPIAKTSEKRAHEIDGSWHHYRPDISNLLKFVEDIATGVIYKDDCLISWVECHKKYSVTPRTEFKITELKKK
jgi:Holliday junction resolvase RusA-like endonuclease